MNLIIIIKSDYGKKDNFNVYYIIVPLGIIIIIITIIIIIICVKRKNRISSEMIENSTSSELFPTPERSNNNSNKQ